MPQFPPHHHHPCVSPPRPRLFLLLFLLASTSSAFLFQIYSVTHEDEELDVVVDPNLSFENPRLRQADIALQAWKSAIFSDPFNFKATWDGSAVCYMGAYCAPSRANASLTVAVGIDLNHADIAGYLPQELGLLADLALSHLNSNRFCGVVHNTLCRTRSRPELAEQQSLRGQVPALEFLDLRFNEFEGPVPSQLFDKDLEAGLGPGESWQMATLRSRCRSLLKKKKKKKKVLKKISFIYFLKYIYIFFIKITTCPAILLELTWRLTESVKIFNEI
jgi:hypothetical protein